MSRAGQAVALLLAFLSLWGSAHAQFSFSDQNPVGSFSGQFQVTSETPDSAKELDTTIAGSTNVIRLKTALLAVTAERFKVALWRQLGLPADAKWSDRIHLHLHPAIGPDGMVTITSTPLLNHWTYAVDLPQLVWKTRFARALSGVLLLELANRSAGQEGRSAEVPAWLVDGLAQQVLASEGEKVVLSAPRKQAEDLAVRRLNLAERGFDPLAGARQLLQNAPALTFDQLNWPTEEQMAGMDGGVYYASAQLFQAELLGLKRGPEKMRAMLACLPRYYNWQTAFLQAFGEDFQRPVDVEKWWSLRVLNFASRTPGPRWTTEVSLARLHELLLVPVESRSASNALPAHAEISLQAALRRLSPEQRDAVLRTTVRNLALVELRLAPPFGSLADAYRTTLADFLGETPKARQTRAANKHGVPQNRQASLTDTVEKLDALDRRQREAELKIRAAVPTRNPSAP